MQQKLRKQTALVSRRGMGEYRGDYCPMMECNETATMMTRGCTVRSQGTGNCNCSWSDENIVTRRRVEVETEAETKTGHGEQIADSVHLKCTGKASAVCLSSNFILPRINWREGTCESSFCSN